MRWWFGPLGLAVRLVVGIACSSSPAEATPCSVEAVADSTGTPSAKSSPAMFDAQVELQGLYDEISQAETPFMTPSDVDLLHHVLYTPDWVFVDANGQRQSWTQLREHAANGSSAPSADSIVQRIQTLALTPDGASVVVSVTTLRSLVDNAGRYGRPGASHTVEETSHYRDRWIRVSDEWKVESREQLGAPTVAVDKPEWRY